MRTNSSFLVPFTIFLLVSSCNFLDFKKSDQKLGEESRKILTPVARAHNSYLYYQDLEGLVPNNISKSDSINLITRYIQSWINKQLVIAEASDKLNMDMAEIERKVLDYRYALLIHEYQKLYILQNLDDQVTDHEIEAYYNENKDNFRLRQTIVKCRFIKVPREAPRIIQVQRLYRSSSLKDFEDLKNYCYQYATTFYLDTTWINFDELIKNSPLVTIDNKIQFLMNNRTYETSDEGFYYYLKLDEYKISNEIAPLEYVREDINRIIINKRKIALSEELEKAIYERAEKNNDFEIFENN